MARRKRLPKNTRFFFTRSTFCLLFKRKFLLVYVHPYRRMITSLDIRTFFLFSDRTGEGHFLSLVNIFIMMKKKERNAKSFRTYPGVKRAFACCLCHDEDGWRVGTIRKNAGMMANLVECHSMHCLCLCVFYCFSVPGQFHLVVMFKLCFPE
ncbi:hypothetical protein BDF20DRAFT_31048 [Mycotypha africana]|uniref:uncharacterized protein n=1 Tax=Mycotypha africana TaxID=64632 RepID=UPI002301D212|nr:uncharacterized protein BDF20DRAFT_31048 [Mycotypha africana]KAI8991238.1 hypothetical protein BDF20DRAFT_31048 [Mycotypha africana]